MPAYYTYLISSLPMLHFGNRPPFSIEEFFKRCQDLITEEDVNLLKSILEEDEDLYEESNPTLKKWLSFDTALRNELVRIRSSRKHLEAAKYLRTPLEDALTGFTESYVANITISAWRSTSILEAEKILDKARWHFLEELAVGHYFDLDFLITYTYKLLILLRWQRVRSAETKGLLEACIRG